MKYAKSDKSAMWQYISGNARSLKRDKKNCPTVTLGVKESEALSDIIRRNVSVHLCKSTAGVI